MSETSAPENTAVGQEVVQVTLGMWTSPRLGRRELANALWLIPHAGRMEFVGIPDLSSVERSRSLSSGRYFRRWT